MSGQSSQRRPAWPVDPTRPLRVIGLASNPSADGVDAAIADCGSDGTAVLAHASFPYKTRLRRAVLDLTRPETGTVEDLCHMNFTLGEFYASSAIKLAERAGVPMASVDLVGSHGQMICHPSEGRRYGRQRIRSTLSIGEPAVIARRTGVMTIADFRPSDVAAGGLGMPLSPYADLLLFGRGTHSRAVHDIGAVSSVTYLPAGGDVDEVVSFDTGPGTMVLERTVALISGGRRQANATGALAERGQVHEPLLAELRRHAYLRRKPPKFAGRQEFGWEFADSVFVQARSDGLAGLDLLATVTTWVAESIALAVRQHLPGDLQEVILAGAGADNALLVRVLGNLLPGVSLTTTAALGVPLAAKSALGVAVLAAESARGRAGNVPNATGADRRVVLGKVVFPD